MSENTPHRPSKAGSSDNAQLSQKLPVVGIGASAGGLEDLQITIEEPEISNEEQLKENNQLFAAILEHTHVLALYLDPQFKFIWVNQSYAKACQHPPAFFPGKNHFDLYPNEENQEIFKRVVDTGKSYFVEAKPFEFPDQPERGVTYWDWSLIPTKDLDGKVTGLVFTLVEVTDRIRAEEALKEREAQYRELVQNANSAIMRWQIDGTIKFFNEYAEDFFGYERDEIIGKDVRILLPEEDSVGTDLRSLVKDVVSNPEQFKNYVNENVRSDGTRVWMAWTNKPIIDENGDVKEILAVGVDITALKEAEMALMKSETEKSLILDNADELIAYHDKENNLTWANRAYQEATGKTLAQLKGIKCFHCWGLENICNGCPVTMAIKTGKPQSSVLTPENQPDWPDEQGSWDVRSTPVRDSEGNIIGAIEIARDITEKRKAEETLRDLSHFPEENPNPVIRCTMEGNIIYANSSGQQWLESLGGKSDGSLPNPVLDMVKKFGEKGGTNEVEITSPHGQTFSILPVRPAGEDYVNLYGVDISERKKVRAALQKAHDDLEHKVMERTAELEWRNRELQEFAYVASHDLQEPLRKIKLFEEMVEKELKEALTDQGQDYLHRMNLAADRMQRLIKSLLSYSRTSSNPSPFERVDLKPIADVIAKDLLPEEEGLTPVIEIDDLPVIDADPVQMHQLLQNLLSNAVHYHKEGQDPIVKVSSRILDRVSRRNGEFCELRVEDNGIGFDMTYVDKIFLPFERLHARNKYEGTGMGLAICRKITELHGGQIVAQGTPGKGATFIVTLPMRQTNEPE